MKRWWIILLAVLWGSAAAQAQADHYLKIQQEDMLVLPSSVTNLSLIGEQPHCYTANLLHTIGKQQGRMLRAEVDTAMLRIDNKMEYVVQHPISGNLFFTKHNKKGISQLYEYEVDEYGRGSIRRIQLDGTKVSIYHPTFSTDGRFMVFHSNNRIGFGGSDLWFCEYRRNAWSAPQNIGHRVNTECDEINPTICGEFLFFASNGRKKGCHDYDLYATRLLATKVTGDTIGMIPIGRSIMQCLPAPISTTEADDIDIVLTTDGNSGCWLRRMANGSEQLFTFTGQIRGVQLSGIVKNAFGQSLDSADVYLYLRDSLTAKVTTDSLGYYELYLQDGQAYTLRFERDYYFDHYDSVVAVRIDEERPLAEMTLSAELARLEFGVPLYFDDTFPQGANTELTEKGKQSLTQVVRFLQQNPKVTAEISLSCDISTDSGFNSQVTDRRIENLRCHLHSQGVHNKVNFSNKSRAEGALSTASGNNLLTILLSK